MAGYITVSLVCLVLSFHIICGQWAEEDAACRQEHGVCTENDYNNRGLAALRSSDCHNYCQCVHASTELDGSVTYMWVQRPCPPTTLFDDSLPAPVCDHAWSVQCHGDDDVDCTSEHGACTKSKYEHDRLFAQTSSGCKKFCQCAHASTQWDGSVTYKWVEHICPAGTLFDSSIRTCNHAKNVHCDGNMGQNEYTSTERPWVQETTTTAATGTGEEGNPCFEEYGYCTTEEYEDVRLRALRRSGCKNFCQCAYASTELDGSVTYKWVTKTCKGDTMFDESLPAPVCNHDYNVQCPDYEESEDCTDEYGACTKSKYEHDRLFAQTSSGCKKFCQCAHASTQWDGSVTYKWVEHTCPAGTLFDSSIRNCNHANNVHCDGNMGQNEYTSTERPWVQETTTAATGTGEEGNPCFEEYGYCTTEEYEDVRLRALRRSGCKNFCQCAYASTELDGSVTYKWVTKTCKGDTMFDESLPAPVCNHDYNVQCPDYEESEDCTDEYGVCTQDMYNNVRLVPKTSSGCHTFCQCAHASTELDGSVTYKWVEHDCPDDTLFDRTAKVCRYADEVECNANQELRRLINLLRQAAASQVIGDDEECLAEYGSCTASQYNNERHFALRSSGCKNFCHCAHASTLLDGSVTYKWVKQPCAEGTLFDQGLETCNFDFKVQCPSIIAEEDGCWREHGTCTKDEYENKRHKALKSSGCQKFCQCAFASTEQDGSVTYYWVDKSCPPRTLFDESLLTPVCNWAYNVNC